LGRETARSRVADTKRSFRRSKLRLFVARRRIRLPSTASSRRVGGSLGWILGNDIKRRHFLLFVARLRRVTWLVGVVRRLLEGRTSSAWKRRNPGSSWLSAWRSFLGTHRCSTLGRAEFSLAECLLDVGFLRAGAAPPARERTPAGRVVAEVLVLVHLVDG